MAELEARPRPGWALFVVCIPLFAVCVNATSLRERFLAAAPGAAVHGFTGAAGLMAVAAVVGAVGSALTLRRRRARRHEEALHAAAHLAAPILTAHHYASR